MAFQFPNVYDLKVFFNAGGTIWTNVYEVLDLTGGAGPIQPTNDLVNRLITFVENNLSSHAQLDHINCYNHRYGTGKLPLAAEGAIWTLSVAAPGQREIAYNYPASALELLDTRAAAYVQKVNNGRVGKLFLHNLLVEGDVDTTTAGQRWIFTGGANTVNPTSFAAQVTGYLASHLSGGTATDYKYCVPHVKAVPGTPVTYQTSVSVVQNFVLHSATWRRNAGG